MIDGKPFAMFFNASPRKGWNTHKMLDAAKAGAEEAGAAAEFVNLYDIKFPGCKSCFACKLKNARTCGVCAIRDALRPVLERARNADVLVLGSPIYFTAMRSAPSTQSSSNASRSRCTATTMKTGSRLSAATRSSRRPTFSR